MVDKFDLAYKFVADWEGGLTDDPADRGGITHYGVGPDNNNLQHDRT